MLFSTKSSPPIVRTETLTKHLRSRDVPLLSVLSTAHDLYTSTIQIFFPRRNEWLLEWLVQRLKEDEGEPGCQARTAKECWDFLRELLEAVEPTIVARTVMRHGIVPMVAKMMGEAKGMAGETAERVSGLLDGMATVLALLRRIAQSQRFITAYMKSTPEVCAGILGDFLEVCWILLSREVQVEQRWIDAVVDLWKGSIWGNGDSKKISESWSEKCLRPATTLLVGLNADNALKKVLESMIAEYVFSSEILFPTTSAQKQTIAKPSTRDLIPLLATLKEEDTSMPGSLEPVNIPYLPLLFRISIDSQSQKHSKADVSVVEILFTALRSVSPLLDLKSEVPHVSTLGGDIVASLLQVLIETGTALPSATLSRIITRFANLKSQDPTQVRWSLVGTALTIDFDSFLHPSVANLTSDLFSALSKAAPSDQVSNVLELVVDGFVKTRDINKFIDQWTKRLKSGSAEDVWRGDALAGFFAAKVEGSLTSPQILKIVNSLREEQQWVILDAILRGLRREDTETQLLTTGALEAVVETARKDAAEWRAWRILVRIGNIKPELLVPAVEDAVWLLRADNQWKEAVFASEVLMQVLDETNDEDSLAGVHMVVDLAAETLEKLQSWDGRIITVDNQNFGLAVAMAVTGGYLSVLEKIDGSHRNKFVDSLFQLALATQNSSASTVNARKICQALVRRPELYEYPAVKDTIFSALILNLSPFSTATKDMSTATSNPPSITPENESRYDFIVTCLLQFPLEALRRTAREKALDTCLLLDIAGCLLVRPLMYKLWKIGNAGSFMSTDCHVIEKWFVRPGVTPTFRRLLSHAFVNRDQEKTRDFLTALLQMTYSTVKCATEGKSLNAGELELSWVVITEFWRFRADEGYTDLEEMRKQFLEQLTKILDSRETEAEILKYWRDVWELERDDRTPAEKLVVRVVGQITKGWSEDKEDADRVVEAFGLACSVAESVDDVTNVTAFAVVAFDRLDRKRDIDILQHYKSMIDRLDISTHRGLTQWVVDACLSSDICNHTWSLAKLLINSIKKPDTPEELNTSLNAFSYIHSRLIYALPSSSSPVAFLAIADMINTLLRCHSWTIIQHNVDTTISNLTITASFRGPPFTPSDPNILYTSLTTILSTILSLHRHRIRGRYYLVTTLLQNLITLLFTPRLIRRKTENPTHPPWLLPPHCSSTLSAATSARALSRVLQTFCDPPMSTVRSNRSELTDSERNKERKNVGDFIGPVLECFVKRVLEERMEGSVRREIAGGVEKVLEVLGRDGVRRVTNRMNGEGRAVVRGLWTEFMKGRGERV
ncbi:Urb2/Npa2 family-domain-containing protein [Trichophaea hybrida]|nr:Urb2/Npa2 family-domain-containing protein [Trichophaea hybrida]